MPKKNITYEAHLIDLLQKLLIFEFYKAGIKRDEITKILGISSVKVSAVTKYLNKNIRSENDG